MCVCVFESGTLGMNHVSVIDRACSCMIFARLIKLTLTRLKMLPSRMAHHLTFHISMLLNWRKADTKVSEVMVFRDSTMSKEVCRPQYMKVMCDEELVIVKVFSKTNTRTNSSLQVLPTAWIKSLLSIQAMVPLTRSWREWE